MGKKKPFDFSTLKALPPKEITIGGVPLKAFKKLSGGPPAPLKAKITPEQKVAVLIRFSRKRTLAKGTYRTKISDRMYVAEVTMKELLAYDRQKSVVSYAFSEKQPMID